MPALTTIANVPHDVHQSCMGSEEVKYMYGVCCADIPVFPTVTAVITLEKYEESKTATHKFLVPRDYRKVRINAHTLQQTSVVCA